MKKILATILLLSTHSLFANSLAECGKEAKSCVDYGAKVFAERCSLCHGSDGMGEGILSLSLKDYPDTNLMNVKHKDKSLVDIISLGSSLNGVSVEMPPWGDELTHTQIHSLSMFVSLLRKDTGTALEKLKVANTSLEPSTKIGRGVFQGRCSLCHGKEGLGDGKMSRIIKNPPPFNLTKSVMPDEYLTQIIFKGGKEMGRSERMPPFGNDLSDSEIKSVIMYIKTLRTND